MGPIYLLKEYYQDGTQSTPIKTVNTGDRLQRGGRLYPSVRNKRVRFFIFILGGTRVGSFFGGFVHVNFYVTLRGTRRGRGTLTTFASNFTTSLGYNVYRTLGGDFRGSGAHSFCVVGTICLFCCFGCVFGVLFAICQGNGDNRTVTIVCQTNICEVGFSVRVRGHTYSVGRGTIPICYRGVGDKLQFGLGAIIPVDVGPTFQLNTVLRVLQRVGAVSTIGQGTIPSYSGTRCVLAKGQEATFYSFCRTVICALGGGTITEQTQFSQFVNGVKGQLFKLFFFPVSVVFVLGAKRWAICLGSTMTGHNVGFVRV